MCRTSSTSMMQLSDAEVKALAVEIEAVSSKEKVHLRPVLRALLEVIKKLADASPLLHKWISQVQSTESAVKIKASEITVPKIKEVFRLGEEQMWNLVEDNLVEVPSMLKRNLQDLKYALYDEDSEATCRIAVDIMLIQGRKYLRKKHESTDPSIPIGNNPRVEPSKRVKLFPEASLSIEMPDPFKPHHTIQVTGRADWIFGYSMDKDDGALLAAVETKQESEFSSGKAQLIAYLAILRENRLQAKKTNIVTQGFYSDGKQYRFVCITADGTISQSRIFEIGQVDDLKMIFNFMVTMLESAMKSTSNASPTKPGRQQEKEVSQFEDEFWLKVFRHVEDSMIVGSDDDMEDVIDLS